MASANAILPLFAVILIGFLAVRSGYLGAEVLRPVGEVVLRIALPALIFLAVASAPPGEGLQKRALLAIAAGSLGSFALGLAAARMILGLPLRQGALIGLGISASNSGFLGFPIVQELFGADAAGRLLAHMMVVENLLMIPLALVLSSGSGNGAQAGLRPIFADLARNPLVLALGAALAVRLTGVTLPVQLVDTLGILARMSAPAALLAVGATLAALRPVGQAGGVAVIVAGKLVLHPALTLLAFAAVGGTARGLAPGAVIFAAMPMISIYPILCQRAGLSPLAATALLATTVTGTATIAAWTSFLDIP